MKVACPSCQALFEADESTVEGPGLPLCEACSTTSLAPPPPPAEGRRKRPQMPDIAFGPRASRPEPIRVSLAPAKARALSDPAPAAEAKQAPPEPDTEATEALRPPPAAKAREALRPPPADGEAAPQVGRPAPRTPVPPAVLDGGFGRSDQPVSVFPAAPPTMRAAEISLGDYGSDVEPVSLRDLEVVLSPPPLPPAWSGSAMGSRSAAASPAGEDAAPASAPPSTQGGDPAGRAAAEARRERLKQARAEARAKGGTKPSFFRVDSVPPPSFDEVNLDGLLPEETPRPVSRPSDLRDLIRPSIRPKRVGMELATLTGALFDEPAGAPLPPTDLSRLAEPAAPDGEPAPLDDDVAVPVDEAPELSPRRALAPPPPGPAPARRVQRSSAPVVAERRAPKPSSGAGGVIAFVGAGILVAIAAFQLGARTAPAPDGAAISASPAEALEATAPRFEATGARPSPAAPTGAAHAAPTGAAGAAPTGTALAGPPPAATPAVARGDRPPDRVAVAETPMPRGADPAPRPASAPAAPREAAVARSPAQPTAAATPALPPPPPGGAPFDGAVAGAALARAAASAAGCRQGDDPSGSARVSITFAPSGRVTSARVVGPPFQSTKTGGCIALSFGSASVPPFAGDPVTVSTDVRVR